MPSSGGVAATEGSFWTNPSVVAFAGAADDPITAVTTRAREVVLDAIQAGWSGPPFDPLALARWLGLRVVPRDDLRDARVVAVGEDVLQVEFNPTRPKARLRYSIAHEIAHTFFPDVGEAVRHRTATGAIEGTASSDDWQLELLCNIAAGELLVPNLALPIEQLDEAGEDINRLMDLRSRFNVSTEAMLRRVASATDHPLTVFAAAPVTAEHGLLFRVDYAVPSTAWDAELKRGTRIPSQVLSECTAVGFTAKGTEAWGPWSELGVQAVGIPPYPRDLLPRVAGFVTRDVAPAHSERIAYLSGDGTRPRGSGPRIIAHVVNDRAHAWGGRGFAIQLKRVHPRAAEAFRAWTIASRDNLNLGNVHTVDLFDGITVASMVAQEGYGDEKQPRLSYGALQSCLERLREAARRREATVHMPPIGTGQGGAVWELVADLVESELCRQGVHVTVYLRPNSEPVLTGASPA